LQGLDTHSMHLEWKAIRSKTNANWKVIDKNCATVVARVLKAGCLGVGAQGSWYTRNPLIWTPEGVMKFAKSLTNWIYATSHG
jgi:RTX toxin RtxA